MGLLPLSACRATFIVLSPTGAIPHKLIAVRRSGLRKNVRGGIRGQPTRSLQQQRPTRKQYCQKTSACAEGGPREDPP